MDAFLFFISKEKESFVFASKHDDLAAHDEEFRLQ